MCRSVRVGYGRTVPMTDGSITRGIVSFAIPIILGNFFQQMYNTADSLIVGNTLGSEALAAVSSSGSLIFLIVGVFNGIFIGAGVVIARYYGAGDKEQIQKAIHTDVAVGLIAGFLLMLVFSDRELALRCWQRSCHRLSALCFA